MITKTSKFAYENANIQSKRKVSDFQAVYTLQQTEKPRNLYPFVTFFQTAQHFIISELQRDNAYLLPVRLFIGLGWLRAGVEKLIEPGWWSGDALNTFLQSQMNNDSIYFPFYQSLVTQLFAPHSMALGLLVMVGQLLAGVAIMSGTFTNLALLGGIFMNLNFVLAGAVNPSAFYLVIQSVLLASNVGAILGGDRWLSHAITSPVLVSQLKVNTHAPLFERWGFLALTIGLWFAAGWAFPYIRDTSPHSVHDPAMLLFILAALGGFMMLIMFVRTQMVYKGIAKSSHT